ncbi:PrsW family intramembrane metalloprotease [Phytohabitans kaempferiae]|uniref:PrsW family intramembrane metalloprotease n=1 Tax=Phytohabitans kaempferiae TaxID=1620943 RepID=A0ABV6LV80_9ACTN
MTAAAGCPGGHGVPPRSARTAPVRPTPAWAVARKSLLLPAFWLVALLLAVGAARMAMLIRQAVAEYPVATITALALFAVYAVPFWLFVAALDYLEREPPLLLATAFAWGGLVATTVSAPGSVAIQNMLAKGHSPAFAAAWGSAIAGPTVEEVAKTLGIVVIVLIARAQINSVLDGVIYGSLVGLGFQVVEDIVYAVSAVNAAGRGDEVGPVLATFFVRGFLAGLWSHTLFSALAGAGVASVLVRTDRTLRFRIGVAVACFLGAWACHFVWNSPLLTVEAGDNGYLLIAVLLTKGIPPLLAILLLVRTARHREADYYTQQLAALDDPDIATPAELNVLSMGHLRANARRHAYARAGVLGRRAVRRLQRAQARLALELSRAQTTHDTASVEQWRDEVLRQRGRLRLLGHPEAVARDVRRGSMRRRMLTLAIALLVLTAACAALSL